MITERKQPAKAATPILVNLANVKPEPVRWLWPARIPLRKLTLLVGDPGLGKSFVTLDIASRVTRGAAWPDDSSAAAPVGGVVLLSAEDDPVDTIRPRLDAAGADVRRVNFLAGVGREDEGGAYERLFNLGRDIRDLEAAIERTPDCRLVVIDPISAYLGKTDSYKNAEVRAVLAPLTELASRRGVAVLGVNHLRKSDGPAIHRSMGSVAFTAAARAAWAVAKDKKNPDRRLMLRLKCNLAAPSAGMAFTIRPGGVDGAPTVAWEAEPVDVDPDEALGFERGRAHVKVDPQRQLVEWIESHGRRATARDLQRGPRRYRKDGAEHALDGLVEAGVGVWETDGQATKGGRPTRIFRLVTSGDGDTTPKNPGENGSCVAVATPEGRKTESEDAALIDKANAAFAEAEAQEDELGAEPDR